MDPPLRSTAPYNTTGSMSPHHLHTGSAGDAYGMRHAWDGILADETCSRARKRGRTKRGVRRPIFFPHSQRDRRGHWQGHSPHDVMDFDWCVWGWGEGRGNEKEDDDRFHALVSHNCVDRGGEIQEGDSFRPCVYQVRLFRIGARLGKYQCLRKGSRGRWGVVGGMVGFSTTSRS